MREEKYLKTKQARRLFRAFANIESPTEAKKFLRDIATISEIEELGERLEIAWLLDRGKTYRDVSKKVNTSTTTVTRVAYWLKNGMGGYRLILDRFKRKR